MNECSRQDCRSFALFMFIGTQLIAFGSSCYLQLTSLKTWRLKASPRRQCKTHSAIEIWEILAHCCINTALRCVSLKMSKALSMNCTVWNLRRHREFVCIRGTI